MEHKKINQLATDILEEYSSAYSEWDKKELARRLHDMASEVAREIIADIEKIIEVDKEGGATFDVRELFKIEKKYTEGEV